MTATSFNDHFSSGSGDYADYRPVYPSALVDALAAISPGRERALDCGCGTGQLSVLLAERFGEVVAIDASTSQIEYAQRHSGVTYRVALAEKLGVSPVALLQAALGQAWGDPQDRRRVRWPLLLRVGVVG